MGSNKKPWLCEGSPWKTESAFWVFVRGVLRKGWSKHPIKLEYIKRYRKRIKNPNPKGKTDTVWGMTCECCGLDTVQKDIQIDHKGDSASFTGLHDAESYIAHLFLIDYTSIRSLCTKCHKIVNNAQSKGLTFEQSRIDKEIIRLMKKESREELLALLQTFNYTDCTNEAKRKIALTEIFTKEKTNDSV